MRRLGFFFASMVLLTAAARADEWKKDFAIAAKPQVRVDCNDGNIRVQTWNERRIQARVVTVGWKIGPDDVRVSDRQSGDRVEIEVRVPSTRWQIGHRSLRVELLVPQEGAFDLQTKDGNLEVDGTHGELRAFTGDGELDLRALDGTLKARTGDGNVRVRGRFDSLDLSTGDGNIDSEIANGSKLNSSWSIRSGDGNIDVRIPASISAEVEARTGDGHVTMDLPVTVAGSLSSSSVRGKLNGGGPVLEVHTGDGNIRLSKSF